MNKNSGNGKFAKLVRIFAFLASISAVTGITVWKQPAISQILEDLFSKKAPVVAEKETSSPQDNDGKTVATATPDITNAPTSKETNRPESTGNNQGITVSKADEEIPNTIKLDVNFNVTPDTNESDEKSDEGNPNKKNKKKQTKPPVTEKPAMAESEPGDDSQSSNTQIKFDSPGKVLFLSDNRGRKNSRIDISYISEDDNPQEEQDGTSPEGNGGTSEEQNGASSEENDDASEGQDGTSSEGNDGTSGEQDDASLEGNNESSDNQDTSVSEEKDDDGLSEDQIDSSSEKPDDMKSFDYSEIVNNKDADKPIYVSVVPGTYIFNFYNCNINDIEFYYVGDSQGNVIPSNNPLKADITSENPSKDYTVRADRDFTPVIKFYSEENVEDAENISLVISDSEGHELQVVQLNQQNESEANGIVGDYNFVEGQEYNLKIQAETDQEISDITCCLEVGDYNGEE